MLAYSPQQLNRIVIELTANCNAMCPGCDRWNSGKGGINKVVEKNLGSIGHMSLHTFNNAIPNELFYKWDNLTQIEFNGSVGDAILHPKFIKFIKLINNKNKQFRSDPDGVGPVGLKLATNAGLHGKEFWTEVGKEFVKSGKRHRIMVALDGTTEETHQQYRRGVSYKKALQNAITLIETGARVRWQFIEFEHNKHQIEEAIKLAEKYGFEDIEVRNSRGGNALYGDWVFQMKETKQKVEIKKEKLKRPAKVEKRQKTRVEKKLNTRLKENFTYKETDKIKEIIENVNKVQDVEKFLDEAPITCQWSGHGSVNVEFNGTVHPCCHMNQGLFYPNDPMNKFYHEVNDSYEPGWNQLKNKNLIKILEHEYFKKDLQDSWKPDSDPDKKFKRMSVCIQTCTKKMDLDSDRVVETNKVSR